MQKLLTIYLNSNHKNATHQHGTIEEHLKEWLEKGWKIVNVSTFGSINSHATSPRDSGATGYIIVVIES